MINISQHLKLQFDEFAKNLQILSASAQLSALSEFSLTLLKRLELGGRLIVCSGDDSVTPILAHHLVEEARIRYKAGKPYGRGDRKCLPTLEIDRQGQKHSGPFPFNEFDNLVVFNGTLVANLDIIATAIKAKAEVLVIGASGSEHANSKQIFFTGNSLSAAVQAEACLHAICEYLEPEPPTLAAKMLSDTAQVMEEMASLASQPNVLSAIDEFKNAVSSGTPIFVIGNGGSACDAQLISTFVNQKLASKNIPIHIECPEKGGQLTCAWNDGYGPFKRTFEAFGDLQHPVLAIGLSTSGNSDNIAEVFEYLSKSKSGRSIALLGKGGGQIAKAAKANAILTVPNDNTAHIQVAQMAFGSTLADLI